MRQTMYIILQCFTVSINRQILVFGMKMKMLCSILQITTTDKQVEMQKKSELKLRYKSFPCRCPSYKLNPGCVMTTDRNDPCCQVPSCTVVPTPAPIQTPAPMPGVSTVVPGTVPTPVPSAYPSPIPTGQVGTIVGQPQIPPLRGQQLVDHIIMVICCLCTSC